MKYRIQLKNTENLGQYYRLQTRPWWAPWWEFAGTFSTFEEAYKHVENLRHKNSPPKTIKSGTI